MDDKPRSSKRSGLAVAILAVPLLLVGYVLSVGPVGAMAQHRLLRRRTWQWIYAPLLTAADECPQVARAAEWYLNRWRASYQTLSFHQDYPPKRWPPDIQPDW